MPSYPFTHAQFVGLLAYVHPDRVQDPELKVKCTQWFQGLTGVEDLLVCAGCGSAG